jgi:hypothetical protein
MDSHEFVALTKRYCVDDVVGQIVDTLGTPRPQNHLPESSNPVEGAISQWINDRSLVERHRSEWFRRLPENDQKMVRDILEECAESAVASFFTLLDGVGGPSGGVFEIVEVNSLNRRSVLNPENTEMLHDIFSELCEEGRQQI